MTNDTPISVQTKQLAEFIWTSMGSKQNDPNTDFYYKMAATIVLLRMDGITF